jgi:hypothetical protein
MAGSLLPRRLPTPQGVQVVASPSGILLAGVVVGVALAAGAALVVAVPLAAAAWAATVAWQVWRMRRGRWWARGERIDPFTLQDPWRRFVQQALQARRRLDLSLRQLPPGPLAERLRDIGGRIHAGVHESWLVAKRGQRLADARRRIDVRAVDRKLAELRVSELQQPPQPTEPSQPADPSVAGLIQSLEGQKATAERLDGVISRAHGELQLLDARMNEAVARVVELSTTSAPAASVGTLDSDIDGLVTELEALRQALDEAYGTSGPEPGALP